MLIVPLTAKPAQTFNIILGGQGCTITVTQRRGLVYLSLMVGIAPVISNVLCRNKVKLVRHTYLGLQGDLVFIDQQGISDPDSTGLGKRFILYYMESGDL